MPMGAVAETRGVGLNSNTQSMTRFATYTPAGNPLKRICHSVQPYPPEPDVNMALDAELYGMFMRVVTYPLVIW